MTEKMARAKKSNKAAKATIQAVGPIRSEKVRDVEKIENGSKRGE